MTEDEARSKWCPLAHPIRLDNGQFVHPESGDGMRPTNCIASNCMMWRWDATFAEANEAYKRNWSQGHCGLAGAP